MSTLPRVERKAVELVRKSRSKEQPTASGTERRRGHCESITGRWRPKRQGT
jgi:hypothetical protein